VTAVELLPVHQHVDDRVLVDKGLTNYWGYNTLSFFAPNTRYASQTLPGSEVREFKAMVKALHDAGIEVILDVVYNHTAEGNHLGPTLSFRGIDNESYYRLVPSNERYYMDYTGCGNTLNVLDTRTLQLPGAGYTDAGALPQQVRERCIEREHRGDVADWRVEVEHFAHALHQWQQALRRNSVHAKAQAVRRQVRATVDDADLAIDHDRPQVTLANKLFDTRCGTAREKVEDPGRIKGLLPRQAHAEHAGQRDTVLAALAQFARCPAVSVPERVIEAAQASVAGGDTDLRHRQVGVIDQALRKVQPLRMCNGQRRGAKVLAEQPPKMPARDAKPRRELLDATFIECAFGNQAQTTPDRCRRSAPGRRSGRTFGPAPQAGPETGFAGSGRAGEKRDVFFFRHVCRADRTAVNAGRLYADKKAPVKSRVA
jgi:hypothetical protein